MLRSHTEQGHRTAHDLKLDAAGNRNVIMVTVNNTNNVCINGSMVNVKRHYNYQINSLIIGGKEEGYTYAEDDVIIFALPSQTTGSECVSNGLLGYRTLDPQNSYFLISSTGVANRLNNNQFDFVAQNAISIVIYFFMTLILRL